MIDCVYIAACARDARFTRICVASIRCFYPEVPIRLLAGDILQRGLAKELQRYWGVELVDLPKGDYGWGFVKLEPLFAPAGERFLILDSDTVITGPVLELAAEHDEDFVVDDEQFDERAKTIYYDWVKAAEDGCPLRNPEFLFNTGQWFGKSGIVSREDFGSLVKWGFPPKLCNPGVFKNGDQGVLNFVVNEQWRAGKIRVARVPLMRWPGHGMLGLDVGAVSKRSCPSLVIHWAGMKKVRQRKMVGADLLSFFENIYYQRIPCGRARRVVAACQDALAHCLHGIQVRIRLATRKHIIRRWQKLSFRQKISLEVE